MRVVDRVTALLPHLALTGMVLLLLYAVGRPLRTADAWLHLELGEAYVEQGPWLDADPILYTATGPPVATAWLFDVALHALHDAAGFQGLRVGHVVCVLATIALAGALLRRASGSAVVASLGASLFIALAGFRFLQLRPHLVSIAFALILYRLLLESPGPPSRRRIALGVLLMGLWANLHAGFLLGPMLLMAALGGLLVEAALCSGSTRHKALARTRALGVALGLGLLATLLNPAGGAPHLSYLMAGQESPGLDMVIDEWRAFPFFGPLEAGLPPSPVSFAIGWLLIVAAPLLGGVWLLGSRSPRSSALDPALVGLACAGALASAIALRFQWLGVFTLLLLARCWRPALEMSRARGVLALASLVLVFAWTRAGDWPRLIEGVPRKLDAYARPYSTLQYQGHATWLLLDAEVEGHLFNRYVQGNYLGYWLAPRLRPFFAGSLNVPDRVEDAYFALNRRLGHAGRSFEDTLDDYDVDVFMGVGTPTLPIDARPQVYTTTHLEGTPGWIPIFRNLRGGLWLRANERNSANLARIAAYYRAEGVPFDPRTGFDAERVVEEAPQWAIRHAMLPGDYGDLRRGAAAGKLAALHQLAMTHATLGLYGRAIEVDQQILARVRDNVSARRRLVWCLLQLGRGDEALEAARPFAARPEHTLAAELLGAAEEYPRLETPAARRARVAGLRVFTVPELRVLFAKVGAAPVREPSGDSW